MTLVDAGDIKNVTEVWPSREYNIVFDFSDTVINDITHIYYEKQKLIKLFTYLNTIR